MWQPGWLSVLSCGSVCRSCVTVIARLVRPPIPRWCPSRWSDCVSPSHQSITWYLPTYLHGASFGQRAAHRSSVAVGLGGVLEGRTMFENCAHAPMAGGRGGGGGGTPEAGSRYLGGGASILRIGQQATRHTRARADDDTHTSRRTRQARLARRSSHSWSTTHTPTNHTWSKPPVVHNTPPRGKPSSRGRATCATRYRP